MSFQVQENVTIKRPISEVQQFLADVQNEERYWQGVKSVRRISGEPGATGAQYERVFTAMGKERRATVGITESKPDRTVVQSEPGPVRVRATMTYAQMAEGTQVDVKMDVETKGLFTKLFQRKIRENIEADTAASLLRLKHVLETEGQPPPVPAPARSDAKTVPKTPAETTPRGR